MSIVDQWAFNKQAESHPVISMTAPPENSVVLCCANTEMLRVASDGFYIRGVKIAQDDKEAEQVYNCFKEWLTWSTMNRT
jgi:hypothetical protein